MVDVSKIPSADTGCETSEPFALRVLGDSMSPEYPVGSIIIIDPTDSAQDGDYVIAEVEDELIFRQFRIEGERHLIKALNPGYPEIDITGRQNIKGIVTQRAGTRRRHRKHYF